MRTFTEMVLHQAVTKAVTNQVTTLAEITVYVENNPFTVTVIGFALGVIIAILSGVTVTTTTLSRTRKPA
jgi:hypothetical protein